MVAEEKFLYYVPEVMKAFNDASEKSLQVGEGEDEVKLFEELRESLIEGYVGILHGIFSNGQGGARGDISKENYAF